MIWVQGHCDCGAQVWIQTTPGSMVISTARESKSAESPMHFCPPVKPVPDPDETTA